MRKAIWAGASLKTVLDKAEILSTTKEILFEGADKGEPEPGKETISYLRSLPLKDVLDNEDILIAYEMNGEPIPIEHGAPLRLIVPNWYGMASVKWLNKITALTESFEGYFQTYKYVMKGLESEEERPVREMKVKSAFSVENQRNAISSGIVSISGFAWSGEGNIDKVEVSVNEEFEKQIKHKNLIFSKGIDLIYEFFNIEKKIKNNILSKSVKEISKNPTINRIFTNLADKGILS